MTTKAGPSKSSAVSVGDDPTAAAIINAAVEAMARHGYHGTTVRDIGASAGVSAAALYHHFSSKHGLLVTILDRTIDLLLRRTESALFHAPHDPAARLMAIVGVHVLSHAESPRESLLGNSELRSLAPPAHALMLAKRDAQQRMFDRVVHDGVARGTFTTSYPTEAARYIVTACTAVASWYRPGGPLSPEEIAQRYQQVALDAVGHRRDGR